MKQNICQAIMSSI